MAMDSDRPPQNYEDTIFYYNFPRKTKDFLGYGILKLGNPNAILTGEFCL